MKSHLYARNSGEFKNIYAVDEHCLFTGCPRPPTRPKFRGILVDTIVPFAPERVDEMSASRFDTIGVDHPSSLPYRRELARLIDSWQTGSSEFRKKSVDRLQLLLKECLPGAFANISVITVHTVAVLLTRDASEVPPKPSWSRHPRYPEPLLISILKLLHLCLTPHLLLPPPVPSSFSALFAANSLSPSKERPEARGEDDHLESFEHDYGIAFDDDDTTKTKDFTVHLPYLDILRAVYLKTPAHPHHLSLAYLFAQLNAIVTDESSNQLRLSAISVISALSDVLDAPLLASFLPALASTLTSLLSKSPKLHSSLAYAALRALSLLLIRVFPTPASSGRTQDDFTEPPAGLEQALNLLSISNKRSDAFSSNSVSDAPVTAESPSREGFVKDMQRRKSLRIQIDEIWRTATAKQLQPRLVSVAVSTSGARSHSHSGVRVALVRFLSSLVLLRNVPLLSEHLAAFRYVLLELCADSYPNVANGARQAIRLFPVTDIEQALAACIHNKDGDLNDETSKQISPVLKRELSVLQLVQSASDDHLRDRLCSALIVILFPSNGEEKKHLNPLVQPRRLAAMLARVGFEPFAEMLVSLNDKCWHPTRVAPEAVAKALENVVLTAAVVIGQNGLLSAVLDALIAITDIASSGQAAAFASSSDGPVQNIRAFKRRAHAALVLKAVVAGALQGAKDEGDAHLADDASKEVLEAMARLFVPTMEQAADEEASPLDDTVITLKIGLLQSSSDLVEEISNMRLRTNRRPVGSDVVIVFLMHLLRDVSHGERVVRPEALKCLQRVALTVHAESHRALIFRHVNYVLARIIRNMEQSWAADVLQFIVGTHADDLSRETMLLLLRTLKELSDGVAGFGDERATQSLHFMRSVLMAALAQQNETGTLSESIEDPVYDEDKNDSLEERLNEEFNVVRKVMLSYCLEDVDKEDEIVEVRKSDVADDLFDGFQDEEAPDGERKEIDPIDSVAESVLDGTRDLLSGRNWGLRATALECATLALRLLKLRKKALLPQVAQLLPLIPPQFDALTEELDAGERLARVALERQKNRGDLSAEMYLIVSMVNSKGAELPVIRHACLLVSEAASHAGSFIKDRFVGLIFPKLRPLLRLCEWFPTLLMGRGGTHMRYATQDIVPSYGAMAACDACLEMLGSIGTRVPTALAPFSSQLTTTMGVFVGDSEHKEGHDSHVNASKLRFERERWIRRQKAGKLVVSALAKACPDETFSALLTHDARAPRELIPECQCGTQRNIVPVR